MAELENEQVVNSTEQNYIDVINDMRRNTVSKSEYERVLNENKLLAQSLSTSAPVESTDDEAVIATDEQVQVLRDKLFSINSNMSNLEYTRTMLDLRDALISRGERDPFLPTNRDYVDNDIDLLKSQKLADGLRQICDYCGNDSQLFNSEIKRCSK